MIFRPLGKVNRPVRPMKSGTMREVTDPLRLLFVLEYYAPHVGGAERLFQAVAERLAVEGHGVTVLTRRLPGTAASEELGGVRIRRVSLPPPRRFWFTFALFPRIYGLARQADLIHASTYAGSFSAAAAGWLAQVPVVLTVHELWMDLWRAVPFVPFWQRWTGPVQERLLLQLPYRAYLAVSDATQRALQKHFPGLGPVYRVPAAVAIPSGLRWRGNPGKGARSFAYFGRPGHWRGLDVLLRGFCLYLRGGGRARLDLILSREPRREYKAILALRRDLNLGDHVRVLDSMPREALFLHLLTVDAAVFPSLSEGFGLAAAEACALGIPVLASDAGSLPEVVSGNRLLFPSGDARALAEALHRAGEGRWDWQKPKAFPVEETCRELCEIYRRVRPCER